jgi:hypothetical protein
MTPDLEALVLRLEALAVKATPGRWHIYGGHNDYAIYSARGEEVEHVMNLDSYEMKPSLANAEHIAAASPDAILQLVKALRDREGEVGRLRAALERYGSHDADCTRLSSRSMGVCTCGFDAALAPPRPEPAKES